MQVFDPTHAIVLARHTDSFQLNMREVARLFGNGATYDAVEGQLRKAKQFAKTLKDEAVGRSEPAAAFPRVKKPKTGNGKETLLKTREFHKTLTTSIFTKLFISCQGCACLQV